MSMSLRSLYGVIFWTMLFTIPAAGCQCGASRHPPEGTIRDVRSFYISNLDDEDVVIEGVVERQVRQSDSSVPSEEWRNYRLVTIRATAVYRGPKKEKFEVRTGLWGGDCGFDFETGESYLIYARKGLKSDTLFTSRCSDTKTVEAAAPDLRILRGEPPAPEDFLDPKSYWRQFRATHTSSVCGRVIQNDGTPASDVSIQLLRERHDGFPPKGYPTQDWYTNSKPDGSYCLEYVPRGRYFMSAWQDDERTDTRFTATLSRFWRPLPIRVESGKEVNGLTLVLHRDLVYSARKHSLLFVCIAGAFSLLAVCGWFIRRRRVG